MNIERALHIADGYNWNVKVGVAAPEHDAIVCLAAEVRRLRHQWQYYQDFCKQNGFNGITAMAVAVDKLRGPITDDALIDEARNIK